MELGELIVLNGFSEEAAEMVIIRKLVGNHVKQLTESISGVERIELTRRTSGNKTVMSGVLCFAGKSVEAEVADSNLFFALDGCLKQLRKDASKA